MRRLLLAAATVLTGCGGAPAVPTMVVTSRPFVQRVTADGVLSAAKATRVAVPPEVDEAVRLAWIAPEGASVQAGELIARFDPGDMEDRLAAGEKDLAGATVEARKTTLENEIKVRELDIQVETSRLALDLARRFQMTDEVLYSRHEIIESALDQELAAGRERNASAARRTQGELGLTRLSLVEIRQRKARLKIDRARAGLAALEVRSPHAGVVTMVRNWRGEAPRVGNQLWPGQEFAEIPDLATLRAEVFVLEADAGGVEAGKPAEVVVEAHPGSSHPATISSVEPVAKPRSPGSPVQYFGVALALERTDPELMKPGQRVRATLLLEQLAEAVVVPRQAVQEEGGRYRVMVRAGRRLLPRAVELGAASAGLVVVSAGLAAGEEIALRPEGSGGAAGTGTGG